MEKQNVIRVVQEIRDGNVNKVVIKRKLKITWKKKGKYWGLI